MNHYKQRNRESIEIIKDSMSHEEFIGFLKGNVYKYLNRYEYKGGVVDLRKASTYIEALITTINKPQQPNPFDNERPKT